MKANVSKISVGGLLFYNDESTRVSSFKVSISVVSTWNPCGVFVGSLKLTSRPAPLIDFSFTLVYCMYKCNCKDFLELNFVIFNIFFCMFQSMFTPLPLMLFFCPSEF